MKNLTIAGTRFCPNCEQPVTDKHWYRSGRTRCCNRRKWTKPLLFQLMGYLERGFSDEQIARKLDSRIPGVTAEAINLARKRHHIPPRRRQSLTAREVARLMGIGCAKTVVHWIRVGMLRGHRGHGFGGQKMWYIRRVDLVAFIENEGSWHMWAAERIVDPDLRRHAIRVGRPAVRFLTPREAGDRLYVEHSTINQWIHKDWIKARRWGNYWIDARDLDRFVLPQIGGRRKRMAA